MAEEQNTRSNKKWCGLNRGCRGESVDRTVSQLLKFKAMNCTRQKRRKQCNGHCGNTVALLAYSKACHETAPKKMKQKNQWKSLRSTKTHVHPLVLELESWQSEFRMCQYLHGKAKRLSQAMPGTQFGHETCPTCLMGRANTSSGVSVEVPLHVQEELDNTDKTLQWIWLNLMKKTRITTTNTPETSWISWKLRVFSDKKSFHLRTRARKTGCFRESDPPSSSGASSWPVDNHPANRTPDDRSTKRKRHFSTP